MNHLCAAGTGEKRVGCIHYVYTIFYVYYDVT